MWAIFEQVSLCQPKIYDIDFGRFLTPADHKIVWFDISVQIALILDVFYPLDHLVPDHQGGLQIESPPICYKEILQGLAKQVHNHNIVFSFAAAVVNPGDAVVGGGVISWDTVDDLGFVKQLWAFVADSFKFDCNFRLVFVV